MGFWKSVGKFAGKTALGIIAPGALAGYEYRKAKVTNEVLKGLDEAIDPFFKNLAQAQEDDSWSELLVLVRGCVVKFLSNEEARQKLLKESHPNEQGRICCTLATTFCGEPSIFQAATEKGAKVEILIGLLNITEKICKELDNRIASAGLSQKEENVVRLLFDTMCTRLPYVGTVMYVRRNNDAAITLSDMLKSIIFSDEEDDDGKFIKLTCRENNVNYNDIKRKMGC